MSVPTNEQRRIFFTKFESKLAVYPAPPKNLFSLFFSKTNIDSLPDFPTASVNIYSSTIISPRTNTERFFNLFNSLIIFGNEYFFLILFKKIFVLSSNNKLDLLITLLELFKS